MEHREIECRFLEIDKNALIEKLIALGAQDLGEEFLEEIIFYDKELTWGDSEITIVKLRKTSKRVSLTYKHREDHSITGTTEIEFEVLDFERAKLFLEGIGLIAFRKQEKRRHTFVLDGVTLDIDTWPSVPTYVELEGPAEENLKEVAAKIGFDWGDVVLKSPRRVIEGNYGIPVSKLRYFTFDKVE